WDKAIRAQDRIKDITFIDGICNDGSDKDEQGKEVQLHVNEKYWILKRSELA
ncbi:hypothetical protein H4S03_009367, partial [Coemansia sp. S3946]